MSIFLKAEYGKSRLTAGQIMKDPLMLLGFGFGSGLSKYMPGTFGTLAALPLYGLLIQTNAWVYSALTIVVVLAGIKICAHAAEKLEVHDFGGIVWDEIAGLLITMWFVPFSWPALAAGFVLFRLFDIVKPWPIQWADRKVDGGLGIMLDDVLAGLFAALILIYFF
ncbi:phosphatidylglycerophosphatase A [Methylomarinum sp. Ch1-1]|uniref:Phosphatidylglycerophosphatase A n=1 Tax=Methylomarinum roseum TaxID=3067653 RepID=A0AAU7NPZ5_9GAMM